MTPISTYTRSQSTQGSATSALATRSTQSGTSLSSLEGSSDADVAARSDFSKSLRREEASEHPSYIGPVSAILVITMLVAIIILLLVTGGGGAKSGALVGGPGQGGRHCPNATPAQDFFHTTPGQRTRRPAKTTKRSKKPGTDPWCDEMEDEPTTPELPCRNRPGGHGATSSTQRGNTSQTASTIVRTKRKRPTKETTTSAITATSGGLATRPTAFPPKRRTPGFPVVEEETIPPAVEPRTRPRRHTGRTRRVASTKTTTTTTTRTPLVCTVSGGALAFTAYPSPTVCSYVFFTHVLVGEGKLRASESGVGLDDFVRSLRGDDFSGYPGGVSFDARYLDPASLDDGGVKLELEKLAANNIRHRGILNVFSLASYFPTLVTTVGAAVTKLRTLMGGDRSAHIVLAAGIWNYNDTGAWNVYKTQFGVMANFDVNILISISSVRTMALRERCQVAPPTVWRTTRDNFPGFDKHATLLLSSTAYTRPDLYVGLSFEMGVMLYQLTDTSTPRERVPYAPCTDVVLVGYEQVCDPKVSLSRMDELPAEFGATSSSVFFYDSWETMKRKVDNVMKLPLRKKIAWMLFDTHLSDVTWECIKPKEREKAFKEYIESFG
ncbi:uncharacterized protein [Dermacentor albipictus]|uniref:uncharacterized protein n=1 Tax=Dermacentor albipictus TaxID=60249 RepID=UPI0038FD22B2